MQNYIIIKTQHIPPSSCAQLPSTPGDGVTGFRLYAFVNGLRFVELLLVNIINRINALLVQRARLVKAAASEK